MLALLGSVATRVKPVAVVPSLVAPFAGSREHSHCVQNGGPITWIGGPGLEMLVNWIAGIPLYRDKAGMFASTGGSLFGKAKIMLA